MTHRIARLILQPESIRLAQVRKELEAAGLASLKSRISGARQRATLAVNQELAIGQQPADQLPWFHLVTLLTKVSADTEREWYATQVIQHGWSRSTLDVHIKNQLHLRQGVAVTNFDRHLPTPHAQLAIEALKDPYLFDFLGLGEDALERDIENALIRHITRFLLELGAGFAFVGQQFRLEVGGDEFFIDLLLYHTRLKCYVVVELKGVAFKPEHAGQLNFYLATVDAQIKAPDDKPIGVAEYQLVRALPEPLDTNLPSIEEIEAELSRGENEC